MSEQQVNDLLKTLMEQTKAINRLAESNEALIALLYRSLADEAEPAGREIETPMYLSGKTKG